MPKKKITPSPLSAGEIIRAEIAMKLVRGEDGNPFPETFRHRWALEAVSSDVIEDMIVQWPTYSFDERINLIVDEIRRHNLYEHSDKNAAILFDVRRRWNLSEECKRQRERKKAEEAERWL
jgi:hypothetical protein